MAGNYFLFYAEASIVCILIFGILLLNDRLSINKPEKQIVFDYALIAHILYFISDTVWAGILGGRIPRTHTLVAVVNFSNFILLSAISYEWFLFAAVSERMPLSETKRGRLLFRLPFAVMTAVMVVAYLIAPSFWVSASGELNGLYYPMLLAAPLTYVAISCIQSLRQAKKAEVPAEHRLFLMIGLYPLAVVFFGVLQLTTLDAPLFCFGCTVMMLFFYIRSMEDMISMDPLTKLNNRGQLFRYAAQERSRRRDNVKTYAVIADADGFKQINDNFGHAEGDRALVRIADALKNAAKPLRYPPFLSRYGGDEFVLIVYAEQSEEVERLIEDIRRSLSQAGADNALPYQLSVSVGYAEWETGHVSFQDCLQRADAGLYVEKRRRSQRAGATV